MCKIAVLLEGRRPDEDVKSESASNGVVGWYSSLLSAGKNDEGTFSRSQVHLVPRRSNKIPQRCKRDS